MTDAFPKGEPIDLLRQLHAGGPGMVYVTIDTHEALGEILRYFDTCKHLLEIGSCLTPQPD